MHTGGFNAVEAPVLRVETINRADIRGNLCPGISEIEARKLRVSRIAAILEKRAGIKFLGQDIYINVAGGIRLSESAVDAALAVAMYSARTDIPVPVGTAIFGELSLAGEIRAVSKIKPRAKTAESLGFTHIYSAEKHSGVLQVRDISSLIKSIFG